MAFRESLYGHWRVFGRWSAWLRLAGGSPAPNAVHLREMNRKRLIRIQCILKAQLPTESEACECCSAASAIPESPFAYFPLIGISRAKWWHATPVTWDLHYLRTHFSYGFGTMGDTAQRWEGGATRKAAANQSAAWARRIASRIAHPGSVFSSQFNHNAPFIYHFHVKMDKTGLFQSKLDTSNPPATFHITMSFDTRIETLPND